MQIYTTKTEIDNYILQIKNNHQKIGFVPTMGALHQGHISLVKRALLETDIVVVSIFVNPKQFNNSNDLLKYPRMIESDIQLLEENGCHAVFMPSNEEMYPQHIEKEYDLGNLDLVLEGKYRPGHFNGVALIVELLFGIIKPDKAFFGIKDFQQLAVIKRVVQILQIPVEIIPCSIIRELDGLAMSSRNLRLTNEQRKKATRIYKILIQTKQMVNSHSIIDVKNWVINQINLEPEFKLDYFEIVDSNTFKTLDNWSNSTSIIGLIAIYLGEIRLIDNLILKEE